MAVGATRHVLCLNSGSSSLRLALFRDESLLLEAYAEGIAQGSGELVLRHGRRGEETRPAHFAHHAEALEQVLDAFDERALPHPDAIGHRIVHGGPAHAAPEQVTPQLIAALESLIPLAPLHLPPALSAIEAVQARLPGIPQVACFDTAFHRRMPELAQRFPLPERYWAQGIRRYGFHGLSYEYILAELGGAPHGRTVIAHLGNGASLAAVADGEPRDTTMGLTPDGGIMMGTRSGDLDPGVLLYLLRGDGMDTEELERLVEHESGLLGVSGSTADMERLLSQRAADPAAARAVELFAYQVRKSIGSLAAVLGGLDRLVFTGGIGEHAAPVRTLICRDLGYLGIKLAPARNATHARRISNDDAACEVLVIPTDEARMIARHARRLLDTAETAS
ncbi:MAG: acetate/propionate family kinase [Gammaproteobacteria bacterium]